MTYLRSLNRLAPAFVGAIALLFLLLAATASAATKITEVTSPGGIKAWLVQEPSIPMLALEISFRGGSALDPRDKAGLANLLSSVLDEGAGELDSQAFQEGLKDLAISLSFEDGRDAFNGSLRTLTKNRDEAFRMLGLALTQARFDDEPVERMRSQIIAWIVRQRENPNRLAGRAFFEAAFAGHPYASPTRGTVESLSKVTAQDMREFVRRRFARDNLIVGAVGDITPEELGRLLDSALGGLPAKAEPFDVPDFMPADTDETLILHKEIPQSVVMFGMPGIKRDDPDYFAAVLLNHVLGGGSFSSRLYTEIREKRGLAYSVYSSVYPLENSGLIIGGVGSANARVAESLALVREQFADVAENGVSAAELDAAKTYITGAFPLRLNSNSRIARTLVVLQDFDLGIDYLDRRAAIINAVTIDDVRDMANRLFDTGNMLTVIVGDPEGIEGREIEVGG